MSFDGAGDYVTVADAVSLDLTTGIALNTWTHLAMTYDGATLRIYVNGTQVGTRAISGAITTMSNPLRIGGNVPWGEYFSGLIDDVKINNRALTAAEIQSSMTQPVTGG